MMNSTYTYKTVTIDGRFDDFDKELDEYGVLGFRVITVTSTPDGGLVIVMERGERGNASVTT
jgi:hypothetical protein